MDGDPAVCAVRYGGNSGRTDELTPRLGRQLTDDFDAFSRHSLTLLTFNATYIAYLLQRAILVM